MFNLIKKIKNFFCIVPISVTDITDDSYTYAGDCLAEIIQKERRQLILINIIGWLIVIFLNIKF